VRLQHGEPDVYEDGADRLRMAQAS
jgi:hypothetical protein